MSFFFFFFQAEDGIRDWSVTGVQTCALPIYVAHEMLEQCAKHPLVCNISIHPYVFGQPFRLRPLRAALKHCVEHKFRERVWWTRPGEIAEFCSSIQPGIIPGS